jgi:hypothetical protein
MLGSAIALQKLSILTDQKQTQVGDGSLAKYKPVHVLVYTRTHTRAHTHTHAHEHAYSNLGR